MIDSCLSEDTIIFSFPMTRDVIINSCTDAMGSRAEETAIEVTTAGIAFVSYDRLRIFYYLSSGTLCPSMFQSKECVFSNGFSPFNQFAVLANPI